MSFPNRWAHRASRRSIMALAAASATVGLADFASAQSGTWTYNGNDNWSTGFVWRDSITPDGADNLAGFGLGVNVLDTLTVTLDSNRTIGFLSFADGDGVNTPAGWVLKPLAAQTLTLQGTGSIIPGIAVNTLGQGNGTSQIGTLFQKIANVSLNLAGTQGFDKTGAGTLVLSGNNSGLSGTITATQGVIVFNSANALGGVTQLNQLTGDFRFRGDTATDYSGANISMMTDATFGTGNSITAGGQYGTGSNQVHTIGDVSIDNYGHRTLGISGSNGYGLTMGRLTVLEGITLINQGNSGSINGAGSNNNVIDAGSGLVTIGTITYDGPSAGSVNLGGVGTYAGNITLTNGLEATGGGTANLIYSGDHTLTINGPIGTGGDLYLTGGTTGSTAGLDYQAGVGTVILNSGTLPSGHAVTINGGSLLLNGAVTHSISALTMGGATLTGGAVPAHLGTGTGTAALGSGGVVVNDSVFFDTGTTTASVIATAGSIAGRVDLGSSSRQIQVNGVSTLDVSAVVSGTGGIIKSGTGALNLTAANSFTGGIDVVDGVVSGKVQAVGNSLGSTGANVSLGGAIRVNGIASPGTATVNTLTSKDTGAHSGLIVDASATGVTTLNINSYGGREGGTHGTIKVVPVTGSLNTNEIIHISTGAPLTTNGILPAYFAVQNSGSDTKLGFASTSANNIVSYGSYAVGGINGAVATAVYDQAGDETLSGAKQLFGLRIGANASLNGAQVLTLGNGTTGFGGLIMNGGAMLNASTVTGAGNDELVVWSGGTGVNTITSNINLNGDLTTGGAQQLEFTGSLGFNGVARNLTVTGGTALLSSPGALSGATGFTKRGGGVLAIGDSNLTFSGPITIASGTMQIGNGGATGDVGTSPITNNAILNFNRSDTIGSFGNSISGSGDLWVNGPSTGIVTLGGNLTYTGRTVVESGTLKIAGTDKLPTGTNLRVGENATFGLNGFSQAINQLEGSGRINNIINGTATISVNGGSFSGSMTGTVPGLIAINKVSSDTLVLSGANALDGGIFINGGTLQVNSAAAAGTGAGADPNITLVGGALSLNVPAGQALTNNIFIPEGATGTISVVSNPEINLGANQDSVGPRIDANFNVGGTLVLDLHGRHFSIGNNNVVGALNNFTGTLKFADANPPGSIFRVAVGVNRFTTGNAAATFDFGNGYNLVNLRNGSAAFAMGWIQGGTNSILEGHANGTGREVNYIMGFLPGDQTYHGQMRDYTLNGGFGIVHLTKVGSNSSLTLKNTLAFTGGITVNEGTLFLASGVNLTNTASLVVNGGTLSMLPGATITSSRVIATVGGGAMNVTGFGTFPTPERLTFTGGGTVYGNVNHNAGSINPGAIGGGGTLTFSSNFNVNNGSVDFDVKAGSVNLLGSSGGVTNDVLQVSGNDGLTLTGGIVRVNFLGSGTTPPPELAVNQFYPLIKYTGTYSGSTSSIFTTAKFRGSFELQQGTGSLSNTLGAKVIALGGATNSLVWNPVSPEFNAWDAAIGFTNWKPLVGAGSLFFFNGDSVTFDDTTTIRTVQITPGLAPTSITVNTDNDYILAGQGFGSITGSTGLVKNGNGTLAITGDNDYTGGTTINGGTLIVGDPTSNMLSPSALGGGNATTTFNNDTDFRFLSPAPNTFGGPGSGAPSTANVAGGNFVFNGGTHKIYIPGSNQTHPWNINLYGDGTLVFQRPNLDNNNSNITFNQGTFPIFLGSGTSVPVNPFLSFTGTLKVDDLTNFLPGSSQGAAQLRDGTILRVASAVSGNASLVLDMGQGTAGFTLGGGANQRMIMGALRGGPNTFLKQAANNTLGVFEIAGVGSQYDSTFDGLFKASNNNNINNAAIQLVSVVKSGSGSTLTLTAVQQYVGDTVINGGTLALVNGSSNPLVSPNIIIGTGGVLDISGLSLGELVLNGDQRLISNGNIVGDQVTAVSTSTVGGTQFGVPLVVSDGATISPGNSVGSLTVSQLQMGQAHFLVEVDQTGIDSLVLAGTQTVPILQSNPSIDLVNLGGFIPGTYTFLDYDGNPSIQTGIENGFTFGDFAYEVKLIHDSANTRVLMQFTNNSAQWFVNSDGTWSTASNWTLDGTTPSAIIPNSVTFGTFIQAPRTVNVNGTTGNVTNSIVFDSPQSYTIAGPGTLTLDSGITAPITVLQGNHAINSPVRALRTLGISVNPGLTLSFGGTINGQNNAGITKIGSGTASFTQFNLPGGTINVAAGQLVMSQKPTPNSATGTSLALSLTVSAGASVDLTNNALVLNSASATTVGAQLLELRAELADGRLFSSTTTSNTTLGYRSNNTGTTGAAGTGTGGQGLGAVANFAGIGVDNTSVLIRVTYKGDTNLDGVVNVLDLVNLALNWQSTNGVWAGGDFNYDGLVNSTDLGILAQGWQLGNGNPLPGDDIGAALTAAGVPLSAVPEPSSMAIVGIGAMGLLTSRRRRRV